MPWTRNNGEPILKALDQKMPYDRARYKLRAHFNPDLTDYPLGRDCDERKQSVHA